MTGEEYFKKQRQFHFEGYDIEKAFNAGMQEMREQMMKDAVDGIVAESAGANGWVNVMTGFVRSKDVEVMFGDKVKLIIIKEE